MRWEMSERKPDGYCVYWEGHIQEGLFATGIEELTLVVHERLEEDAADNCMEQTEGWRIVPVWLSTKPPMTDYEIDRKASGFVDQYSNGGRRSRNNYQATSQKWIDIHGAYIQCWRDMQGGGDGNM